MKVLVAYDGSECADAAIDNLKRAGLPARLDALVVTIADVWPPPAIDVEGTPARIVEMQQAARITLAQALSTSQKGAIRLRSVFPNWTVKNEASADSPAWGILNIADRWGADLIVVGSHGMSALDRLFIGSVSQRVMAHARRTVRVARTAVPKNHLPIRLIVGFDGSADAEAAVREVASRTWPAGTEVQVVTALDARLMSAVASKLLNTSRRLDEYTSGLAEAAVQELRSKGLIAKSSLVEGEPKYVLTKIAEEWRADAIFVGATGLRGLRRLLLGSVSSAVTSSAPCTVEVVRATATGE
jgi:nucleotide-binding universal stress UspA family protein